MNNYSTNNSVNQYQINEAKKRMGTYSGNAGNSMTNAASGAGFTNGNGQAPNAAGQAQLKSSEKMQAQEDMNNNSMY